MYDGQATKDWIKIKRIVRASLPASQNHGKKEKIVLSLTHKGKAPLPAGGEGTGEGFIGVSLLPGISATKAKTRGLKLIKPEISWALYLEGGRPCKHPGCSVANTPSSLSEA